MLVNTTPDTFHYCGSVRGACWGSLQTLAIKDQTWGTQISQTRWDCLGSARPFVRINLPPRWKWPRWAGCPNEPMKWLRPHGGSKTPPVRMCTSAIQSGCSSGGVAQESGCTEHHAFWDAKRVKLLVCKVPRSLTSCCSWILQLLAFKFNNEPLWYISFLLNISMWQIT